MTREESRVMKYRKKPVVIEAMQFTEESKDRASSVELGKMMDTINSAIKVTP